MPKGTKYQIQIIQKLPNNGRPNRGSMNTSWIRITKDIVTSWIKNNGLHTSFPYGLNDKVGEEYRLYTTDIIDLKFPSLRRSYQNVKDIKH